MNWVDLCIIVFLFIIIVQAVGRSFFAEIFDLLGFVVAFLVSLRFYNLVSAQLAEWFSLPHSLAQVLGFISVWYFIEISLVILFKLFGQKLLDKVHLEKLNTFSFIPSVLKGLVIVAIILVIIATFPIQPTIKKDVNESYLGSKILAHTLRLEAPLKKVFGGFANDTLTFLTVKPKTSESVSLNFQTQEFNFDEGLEGQMIELVNSERQKEGLKPLTYAQNLRDVGRVHSADMFKRGYFSHYSPEGKSVADRAESQNVFFLVIGENLAYAPSLQLAHQGLMNSPGHRANILSEDYHKIGIGVADGGIYGIMFTQVFSN